MWSFISLPWLDLPFPKVSMGSHGCTVWTVIECIVSELTQHEKIVFQQRARLGPFGLNWSTFPPHTVGKSIHNIVCDRLVLLCLGYRLFPCSVLVLVLDNNIGSIHDHELTTWLWIGYAVECTCHPWLGQIICCIMLKSWREMGNIANDHQYNILFFTMDQTCV